MLAAEDSAADAAARAIPGAIACDCKILNEWIKVVWIKDEWIKVVWIQVDSEPEDLHLRQGSGSIRRRLGRLLGFEPRTSAATERRSATEL